MRIKRLVLHNFGVYAGTNIFEFRGEKPIVLIGGLNGRGKTTFLEAILLSLYGANSFAYQESGHTTYGNYLKSFVNESDNTLETFVEMEFVMGGEDEDSYKVHRSWNGSAQRIHETISIEKAGVYDEFLTNNWSMFVENILPSALSNFFFFDGEKISDIAVDDTDEQLKESIRSMLGLSLLDRLSGDIQRTIRRKKKELKQNHDMDEVERLQDCKEKLERQLSDIDAEISECEEDIYSLESLNERDQMSYSSHGGDVVEQRHEILEKRAVIREKLNHIEQSFIDASSQALPFSLIENLVEDVVEEAENEQEYKISKVVADKIGSLYKQYAKEQHVDVDKEFLKFVKKAHNKCKNKSIYNISSQTLYAITELQTKRLPMEMEQVKGLLKENRKLKKQLDEIDGYLTVDINENELSNLFRTIKEREQNILSRKAELNRLKQERASVNGEYIRVCSELGKMTEQLLKGLENKDDGERYLRYSQIALQVIEKYEVKLQETKTNLLAEQVTSCYKNLASKKNLIDRIVVDSNTLEMKYLNADSDEVPKSSLSAGEKQLMVISILWALAICSKKKLPVIIDTPLSRLDSNHRRAIIKRYFPKASEQTIILSTDSEIDQKYYNLIKKDVGDEFTLIYDDEKKSTTIKKGYLIG